MCIRDRHWNYLLWLYEFYRSYGVVNVHYVVSAYGQHGKIYLFLLEQLHFHGKTRVASMIQLFAFHLN